ncbi:MAG: ABC transporter substrate-binding protein [Actinobacteria bacterium]|nr:ABC transporter substrate-binding protein [Actinomycetota bacterium]
MNRRTLRTIAVGSALAFVLGACGQKPGVHVEGGTGGQPLAQGDVAGGTDVAVDTSGDLDGDGFDDATGAEDLGGTAVADDTGGGSFDAGTTDTSGGTTSGGDPSGGTTSGGDPSGGDTSGGTTSGGDTSGGDTSGGQQTQDSGGKKQVTGSDRTGLTAEKMTFASHAPVTGAAPLPTTSFEKSGDLYWRNLTEIQKKKVLGRSKVELLFRDDKYDPNSARQVCRELASKAFTVAGGGGTDQIQACGQFAKVAEFPYFSAGVTEAGLRDNPWYFAASMSYKQQGPLLAQMVKKNFGGKKVAAIITDTPNFDDAIAGWEAGVKQQGLNYYKTLRHPKGDTSWYNAFAGDLKANGVEVVYILSSPVDYIRFAQQASQSGIKFQYVGVGVSMGLNAVLGSGCDEVDGGMFFSPFPGLDYARKNVPGFFETAKRFNAPADDIAFALWGQAAVQHDLLLRYEKTYGPDLTREDFRDLVETQTGIGGEIFPTVNYSPQNHFGSTAVHLLRADCSKGEYVTVASFAKSF